MYLYLFMFISVALLACYENQRLSCSYDAEGQYVHEEKPSWLVFFVLFFFACVSGFSELGGSDYDYYAYFYNLMSEQSDFVSAIANSQYEKGYSVFVYICTNVLHLSYNGYRLVENFLFYWLMYIGLRKYVPNWGIFLMLFLYKMFFYVTMVAMRQAVTIAGFFVIMRFLEERQMIKYYVTLLLVSSFHFGALLLFVLYPLFSIRLNKDLLIRIGCVFAVLTLFSGLTGDLLNVVVGSLGLTQIEDKAMGYSSSADSLNILYTVEYYMLFILVVVYYDDLVQRFKSANFIMLLFLMALPMVTLFRSTSIFVRELYYFYPTYAILLYYVYSVSQHRLVIFSAFGLMCLLGIVKYVVQFGEGHYMNYEGWLFDPYIQFFQS